MCLKFQIKVQQCMEGLFSSWANIVSNKTFTVFFISLGVFVLFSKSCTHSMCASPASKLNMFIS